MIGGLHTRLDSFQQSFFLSLLVASTGVIVPIGMSFLLLCFGYGYSASTAFACGAALASTSLGTTFFILSAQSTHPDADPSGADAKDMRHSRIGSVLLSAALIDDVIGLILVAILPTITASNHQLHGGSLVGKILRPIGVSAAFFLVVAMRPIRSAFAWALQWPFSNVIPSQSNNFASINLFVLVVLLSGFAAASFYAGASLLLGAWVAGCLLGHADEAGNEEEKRASRFEVGVVSISRQPTQEIDLQPMPTPRSAPTSLRTTTRNNPERTGTKFCATYERFVLPVQTVLLEPFFFASIGFAVPFLGLWTRQVIWRGVAYAALMAVSKMAAGVWIFLWPISRVDTPVAAMPAPTRLGRPVWPTLFLSIAMVARGEIGLIIAQLGGLTGEPYLVVMWAILLCTVSSAVSVGSLLRRRRSSCTAGVWGQS